MAAFAVVIGIAAIMCLVLPGCRNAERGAATTAMTPPRRVCLSARARLAGRTRAGRLFT
jgi:hypothetical protein